LPRGEAPHPRGRLVERASRCPRSSGGSPRCRRCCSARSCSWPPGWWGRRGL